jgi:hypothetical protein
LRDFPFEVVKPGTSVKVGVYVTRAHCDNIDAVDGNLKRKAFRIGCRKRFRGRVRTGLPHRCESRNAGDNDDRSASAGNHAGDDAFAEPNDARSHEVGEPVDLWAWQRSGFGCGCHPRICDEDVDVGAVRNELFYPFGFRKIGGNNTALTGGVMQ